MIVPRFRDRDFSGGIESGISAITQTVQGEAISPALKNPGVSGRTVISTVLLFFAGTALFGALIGFVQPSLLRAAANGSLVSAVIGSPAIATVGVLFWMIGMCIGAMASMSAVHFARRARGRSWNGRRGRQYDFSPRDTFTRGYGGGSGGFSGGGGFGGGGDSGGW